MDWDKLRIFHAAAEAGSFTHAGESLRMSQSAVSRQVSALEKELKVALFHRHARGLVLTEQGEMLFGTASEIMSKLSTAETLLTKEGCEVFTAVDGFDALAKIADHQPDIVFVDIMMPRLDGYQTCSLIKHNKVYKSIPVIMLSSKDGLFDRARGRIVGSEHYLTKPFTKDELLSAIESHIGS